MFWKKKKIEPIKFEKPIINGCEPCVNQEEAELNKRWANVDNLLKMYAQTNVANLSAIERAQLNMAMEKAKLEWSKIDIEIKEFVRKTYG